MASGKTHEKFSVAGLITLIAVTCFCFFSLGYTHEILYAIPGGILAFLIDPDMLDQHNITTRGENRLYKFPLVGFIIGYIVEILIFPLARIIPHRSMWSHFPLLCSALRMLYVCMWYYIIHYIIYLGEFPILQFDYMQLLFFYLGGVWIDITHTTLDKWRIRW